MLVLSRKKDETIILKTSNNEVIQITVVKIDNKNKVRIGIDAPRDISVVRSELIAKEVGWKIFLLTKPNYF